MKDIIDAINAAEDNDQLARIAKDLLNTEISDRRKVENNKKILLEEVQRRMAGDDDSGGDGAPVVTQRKLKNTENGRVFIYTEALAKLSHMVEVED